MSLSAKWAQPALLAAKQFGTPLYLYDAAAIEERLQFVRSKVGHRFRLRYAVKTNPNPALLRWLRDRVESLDVSSGGEIRHALAQGWPADLLEFTGPAKTAAEIALASQSNIRSIVLEDLDEARLLSDHVQKTGQQARVLLRIAPALPESGFAVRLAGRPTQFGVDEEKLPEVVRAIRDLPGIRLAGFHIYSGSQCLDDAALANHFWEMWQLFRRSIPLLGDQPAEEFVFGGGMGIPYHDGDPSLTLEGLPEVCARIEAELLEVAPEAQAYIEAGRFLVGEAGLFITEVIRVKESRGLQIALCNGGMNHNLGACGHLGGVAHRHYSLCNLSATGSEPEQTYRLVGPLCTAIDTLALRVKLPEIRSGDLIGVGCSGGYGPTASPLFFISHAQPKEVLMTSSGSAPSFEDVSWLPRQGTET